MRGLYDRLRADGLAPWLDEEHLLPGENWELAIRNAVRGSDFVAVCLSRASTTAAGYVHKEIKQALDVADEQPEGSIFVTPVRLEDCEVPYRLRHLHWVDLFSEVGYSRLLRVLRQGSDPGPRPERRGFQKLRVMPPVEPRAPSARDHVQHEPPPVEQRVLDEEEGIGSNLPPPVEQRVLDEEGLIGRNDPCWCGSGKKFKKCHGG